VLTIQISLVLKLGIVQQSYSSNFLGQNAGSNATAKITQISLVKMLVIVQQLQFKFLW
jgi:hypothetical protein